MRVQTRRIAGAAAVLCASLAAAAQDAGTTPRQNLDIYRPHITAETASQDRTDINHASMSELLKVPGMTRSWAGRIVRFRPYHTKLDLMERGVVSDQVYNRIKDYVIAHRDPQ